MTYFNPVGYSKFFGCVIVILTLIPCMCISPLKGVHSSFSFVSGSSMIFPLREDKTSPDADVMTLSWI